MHALLYLVISLFAVAVVFYTLGAPFVAALEVIVYAGAIMMLFLFAVMLLNVSADSPLRVPRLAWLGPAILVAVLLAEVIYGITRQTQPLAGAEVGPQAVSEALYGPYVLGVELASMLLLAALIGARHVAARARDEEEAAESMERARAGGRRRERPPEPDLVADRASSRGGRRLMASVSLDHGLVLAAILFAIGFAGLLTRRNLIVVLACIEIMLNAAGLAFVAAGARWGQADGQVMFLFVLAMAAAEVAVGLAIAIRFRQSLKSLDVDDADEMKG